MTREELMDLAQDQWYQIATAVRQWRCYCISIQTLCASELDSCETKKILYPKEQSEAEINSFEKQDHRLAKDGSHGRRHLVTRVYLITCVEHHQLVTEWLIDR